MIYLIIFSVKMRVRSGFNILELKQNSLLRDSFGKRKRWNEEIVSQRNHVTMSFVLTPIYQILNKSESLHWRWSTRSKRFDFKTFIIKFLYYRFIFIEHMENILFVSNNKSLFLFLVLIIRQAKQNPTNIQFCLVIGTTVR